MRCLGAKQPQLGPGIFKGQEPSLTLIGAAAPSTWSTPFPGPEVVRVGALVEQNASTGNELGPKSCFDRFGGSECSGADLG